jgi:hypothetical protein
MGRKKMIINCTPHKIVFNSGKFLEVSGVVARVKASYEKVGNVKDIAEVMFEQAFGDIEGLPENASGDDIYVVSAIVLAAAKAAGRTDCVAPATGHPEVVRNEAGQIASVPGLVR